MPRLSLQILFVGLLSLGSVTQAEEPVRFSGWRAYGLLDEEGAKRTETRVIQTAEQWQAFLDLLPAKVPGDTTRIDADNPDPILKAKIDWSESMVVVVCSATDAPRIVAAAKGNKADAGYRVKYALQPDFSAHPDYFGFYAALVLPRSDANVVFEPQKRKRTP